MADEIQLEFRDVEFRAASKTEDREIVGLAVPYGKTITVGGYSERFERGDHTVDEGAPIFYGHDHRAGGTPIGKILEARDTDEGIVIRARISETAKGNEVYQLARDEVLTKFSIGFEPIESRQDDTVIVHTRTRTKEVSVVPFPAYATANISEVRSEIEPAKETAVDDTTDSADLTELRDTVTELQRRMAVMADAGGAPAHQETKIRFRSLGEFVKALAPGKGKSAAVTDEERETLYRAYTGAQISDNLGQAPTWVARDLKLIAQNRDVLEFFSKQPLPAEGMTINYPVFNGYTGDVAVQAAEGDDLTYLEIATTSANAPVKTYGAYSQLTRQLIERNDVSFLNKTLEQQRLSYAKVTNSAVRTLLGTTPAAYNQGTVAFANRAVPQAWVQAMVNGVADISQNSSGLEAGAWIMGRTQAVQLATLVDSAGRPVFVVNGDGVNSLGNVDLRSLKMNVGGLPVLVDFGLTGTDSFICSADALTVLEDGAKYLDDDNIINLTRAFSIYGYLAVTKNDVKGVTRITHPAA